MLAVAWEDAPIAIRTMTWPFRHREPSVQTREARSNARELMEVVKALALISKTGDQR